MSGAVLAELAVAAAALLALAAWRRADARFDRAAWSALAGRQPAEPEKFDPAALAGLPEPAQRFFRFAIRPGTPLRTVAEISMTGEFGLGTREKAKYLPMRAEQILAAPHGFVWQLRTGGALPISGSDGALDGASWSRFWLLGLLPGARAGGNRDHARAAFGRYVAEAAFWTPAALLPAGNVRWEAVDDTTARVTLTHDGLAQSVDLSVDAEGRPVTVVFQRWSDANPDRRFRLQPFGGYLSDFADFGGFRLPTRIEAGNFFGTEDYFPFFRVRVTAVRFPG